MPVLPAACWQAFGLPDPSQASVVHGLPSSVHAVPLGNGVWVQTLLPDGPVHWSTVHGLASLHWLSLPHSLVSVNVVVACSPDVWPVAESSSTSSTHPQTNHSVCTLPSELAATCHGSCPPSSGSTLPSACRTTNSTISPGRNPPAVIQAVVVGG